LDITLSICHHVRAHVAKGKSHFIQSASDDIAVIYDLHHFESDAERLEVIDSLQADDKYLLPVAECSKVVYQVQIQRRKYRKRLTNAQRPLCFLVKAIPEFICIQFYHRVNNRGKYVD